MPPEQIESKPDLGEFTAGGGEVVTVYDDGRPKRWRCGRGADGQPLDPPLVDRRNILHRLAADGSWEGVNPTAEDIAELKLWRSDWSDLHKPSDSSAKE